MISSALSEVDLIEELRLRRWARENYVARGLRQKTWHPIIHEEMKKKDGEGSADETTSAHYAWMKS